MTDGVATLAPEGGINVLEHGDGHVFIMGWFRLASHLPEAVPEMHIGRPDEAPIIWPLRRLRPHAHHQDARSFQILLPFPGPRSSLVIRIVQDGVAASLTPKPRLPTPFRRRGALEQPGRMGITGWVLDLPGEQPVLLVDGRMAIPLNLNCPRPDLPFDEGAVPRDLGFHITLEALGEQMRAQDPAASLMDGEARGFTLLLGGVEHQHRSFSFRRSLDGALERADLPIAEGWASEAAPGPGAVTVDVLLDGTRWLTIPAASPRADLLAHGVGRSLRGGAFRLTLPRRSPSGAEAPDLALQPAHGQGLLGSARQARGMAPWRVDRGGVLDHAATEHGSDVTVIIPIHNAAADLARCIESVLRHTTGSTRLLLIDDASTDPAISEILAMHQGRHGVTVLRHETCLGFTATCNHGIAAAGDDDVVLLNSDTVVGPNWLDGLRLAASGTARIGTVTPLSNNAGAFSVPEIGVENHFPAWFSPADMARLARQASLSLWPEVPTGNGFCLYIRRACLRAVGLLDTKAFPRGYGEENDFCLRAQEAGFIHLVDDRTFVWHRRVASFGAERQALIMQGNARIEARYPEYQHMTRVFADGQAWLALRWRIRRAVEAAQREGALPKPRILFVISTRSGGTPMTNGDLMGALSDRYEPWLLRCEAGKLEFGPMDQPALETHFLDAPVSPATHRSLEYDHRVADLLIRHGIELVHIRHIAWHGIGLPDVCRRLHIPVVFSFHDFYTACPTVKLLDGDGNFCGGRCTQGATDCEAELWTRGEMPPLRDRFVHRWRAMMADAIVACDAFVTTSHSARETLLQAFPFLEARDLQVIEHGRSFARMESFADQGLPDGPLRVLVPGHIFAAKGSAMVAALAALDDGCEVEFHIIGDVDDALRSPRPGVVLHGPYDRDAFGDKVRAIRPHLGAVFSIWPETWCHTLTECWAAGLPVLTLDLGAQAERVRATEAGWILPHDAAPGEVLTWLSQLKRDPEERAGRIARVLAWQDGKGKLSDNAAIAAAYDEVYHDVLARRRSFRAPDAKQDCPVLLEVQGGQPRLETAFLARPGTEMIQRPVSAAFPFARTLARRGRRLPASTLSADLVLLGRGSLALEELTRLLRDCREATLPVLVQVDGQLAAALATPDGAEARALLGAEEVTLVALRPVVARSLKALGLPSHLVATWRDPQAWRIPLPPEAALPSPCTATCRVLVLDAAEAPPTSVGELLEELGALGVVEACCWQREAARLPAEGEPVLTFRRLARDCDFAVLTRPACELAADTLVLAALGEGLPVLVDAGLIPDDEVLPPGVMSVASDAETWARTVAEMGTEPMRRGALGRAGARHLLATPGRDTLLRGWRRLVEEAIGE